MRDTVFVDGIEMDYCRFGTGKKPFVVIPGLSVQPVVPLEKLVEAAYSEYTDEFLIYLFDRRTNNPEEYSIEEMAHDTAEVIKHLGLENIVLYGASQGGMIAEVIAADHPELVETLILTSTAPKTTELLFKVISGWISIAGTNDGYELYKDILTKIYSGESLAKFGEAAFEVGKSFTEAEMKRFCQIAKSLLVYDGTEKIKKIKCRTLVIGCEGDGVMGVEASRSLEKLLGCELYIYDDRFGHAVYDEAPDFAKKMFGFALSEK